MYTDFYDYYRALDPTPEENAISDAKDGIKKLRKELDEIKFVLSDHNLLERIERATQLGILNIYILPCNTVMFEDSRTSRRVEITVGHTHS